MKKSRTLAPPPKPFAKPLQNSPPSVETPSWKTKSVIPAKAGQSTPPAIPAENASSNGTENVVLLYTAPSHGMFYLTSYLAGGFFILGAYMYAELVLKDPKDGSKQPWWKKTIGAVSAIAAASFGTVFILGPMGMIKSISIVASEAGYASATTRFTRSPRLLRIEVKRKLPFLKPDVLETDVSNVNLDRRVPLALQDLNFRSISRNHSESWTAAYFKGAAEPARLGGVTAAIKGAWPATRREVRRMFLRDQIAYVTVKGNGNFKLDLQGCRMLEGGQVLDRVLPEDLGTDRSIRRWFANLLSG